MRQPPGGVGAPRVVHPGIAYYFRPGRTVDDLFRDRLEIVIPGSHQPADAHGHIRRYRLARNSRHAPFGIQIFTERAVA
jgi:hypothetical protein